jgi:predicted TIM-barrel fold metal-dependent hydrolase
VARPERIQAVDLMIGFPSNSARQHYDYLRAQTKDAESNEMEFPAEYMFKDVPNKLDTGADPIKTTLAAMDRNGVGIGLTSVGGSEGPRALHQHPDRFRGTLEIDPNDIGRTVHGIRHAHQEFNIVAVTSFPAGCNPQVPVSDRRYYPVFQTCVDLDIPIVLNAGIAGPRLPSACQDVMHFDEVCFDFPDLKIVMRHGAEPWQDLAVKLMLKWPGLYYMTSGFAPKYYPPAIIDYANTRGTEKIMYAGYYPMGLSLDRIFDEMSSVPLRDHVWEPFLRSNAMRVFKLGNSDGVQ